MDAKLQEKYNELGSSIRELGSAIIAFSGGVDSALVLKIACAELGSNAVAVTADSPSLPRRELEESKKTARSIGARHIIIKTEETLSENYLSNPENRCYYCKHELYSKLKEAGKALGINNILNGTNSDDLGDYLPGLRAAEEFSIISPLKDANMTKSDVRQIAKSLGLPIWDKPAAPCLSSRVPYWQRITMKRLSMIEQAENFLKDIGIKELRVRHLGSSARIEVKENERGIIDDNFEKIKGRLANIGFEDVTIADFKSGSLNVMVHVQPQN